jgi:hypothetical protein
MHVKGVLLKTPNHQKGTMEGVPQSLYARLIFHKKEKKDIIEGIVRINAKPPHQMNHVLSDQEEGEKQVAPLAKEQKGCMCTIINMPCPNGRRLKNLKPKSKLRPLGGKGVKEDIEEPRM